MFFFIVSMMGYCDDEGTRMILAENEADAVTQWKLNTPNYEKKLESKFLKLHVQNLGDATSCVSKVFTITTG